MLCLTEQRTFLQFACDVEEQWVMQLFMKHFVIPHLPASKRIKSPGLGCALEESRNLKSFAHFYFSSKWVQQTKCSENIFSLITDMEIQSLLKIDFCFIF